MRGFSLLEIIIAIAVLASGIAGAIALINQAVSAGVFAQKQLIAAHLAQEGMEVVHNIRHTNWIQQRENPAIQWDRGLVDGNSCVNFSSASLSDAGFATGSCNSTSQRALYLSGNRYRHCVDPVHCPVGAESLTDFSRYIAISHGTDSDGKAYVLMKSIVEWGKGSIPVEERLYDWK